MGPLCFNCRRNRNCYEASCDAVRNRVGDKPWASVPRRRYWRTL